MQGDFVYSPEEPDDDRFEWVEITTCGMLERAWLPVRCLHKTVDDVTDLYGDLIGRLCRVCDAALPVDQVPSVWPSTD